MIKSFNRIQLKFNLKSEHGKLIHPVTCHWHQFTSIFVQVNIISNLKKKKKSPERWITCVPLPPTGTTEHWNHDQLKCSRSEPSHFSMIHICLPPERAPVSKTSDPSTKKKRKSTTALKSGNLTFHAIRWPFQSLRSPQQSENKIWEQINYSVSHRGMALGR